MTDARRSAAPSAADWPELPLGAWQDTCDTLQLWTQVVGKIRLAKAPMMNHWWQVPLYVTCRGLTTSPIPHDSGISFQFDLDFIDHRLRIEHRWRRATAQIHATVNTRDDFPPDGDADIQVTGMRQ